jgi:hypothetical protein
MSYHNAASAPVVMPHVSIIFCACRLAPIKAAISKNSDNFFIESILCTIIIVFIIYKDTI